LGGGWDLGGRLGFGGEAGVWGEAGIWGAGWVYAILSKTPKSVQICAKIGFPPKNGFFNCGWVTIFTIHLLIALSRFSAFMLFEDEEDERINYAHVYLAHR
jgi:hypothetical protein